MQTSLISSALSGKYCWDSNRLSAPQHSTYPRPNFRFSNWSQLLQILSPHTKHAPRCRKSIFIHHWLSSWYIDYLPYCRKHHLMLSGAVLTSVDSVMIFPSMHLKAHTSCLPKDNNKHDAVHFQKHDNTTASSTFRITRKPLIAMLIETLPQINCDICPPVWVNLLAGYLHTQTVHFHSDYSGFTSEAETSTTRTQIILTELYNPI